MRPKWIDLTDTIIIISTYNNHNHKNPKRTREIFAAMHEDLHKPEQEADLTEVPPKINWNGAAVGGVGRLYFFFLRWYHGWFDSNNL